MLPRLFHCVSPSKADGDVAAARCVPVRERILRFLFVRKEKLPMIIPGDSVKEMAIHEVKGRVQTHDKEGSKLRGCLRGGVFPKFYRLKLKVMTPSLYDTARLPFMSLAMSRAMARPMP